MNSAKLAVWARHRSGSWHLGLALVTLVLTLGCLLGGCDRPDPEGMCQRIEQLARASHDVAAENPFEYDECLRDTRVQLDQNPQRMRCFDRCSHRYSLREFWICAERCPSRR